MIKKIFIITFLVQNTCAQAPRGLPNCGNSCYMNSVLQSLYNVTPLRKFLKSYQKDYLTGSPTVALINIFDLIESAAPGKAIASEVTQSVYEDIIDPLVIKKLALHPDDPINIHKQQDAAELLTAFYERFFGEADNNTKDIKYSEPNKIRTRIQHDLKELLYFIQKEKLICRHQDSTESMRKSKDTTSMLQLSIPEMASTLEECLNHFIKPEQLDTNFDWCQAPGSKSYKQYLLGRVPTVATIQLKLFYFDIATHNSLKILQAITIPEKLEIEKKTYALTSIIVHVGALPVNGHYLAYIKPERDIWYRCDDESIIAQDPPFLTHNWHLKADDTGRPYILFYEQLLQEQEESMFFQQFSTELTMLSSIY